MIKLLFGDRQLYSWTEIEMSGHLVRYPEVGLGLLLVMATVIAPAATADDIALVPLMTADGVGVGIAFVVVFENLQAGKYFQQSLLQ